MLDQVREGDTVVVWKPDRLSRSLKNVLHIMERIAGAVAMEWEDDKVFEGRLDEAILLPGDEFGVRCTPSHWFPKDRSWLVRSGYDLTFSLFGGSETLIHQLLNHPVLECVRVFPSTRVGRNADLGSTVH